MRQFCFINIQVYFSSTGDMLRYGLWKVG